jgi:hypothetical protein
MANIDISSIISASTSLVTTDTAQNITGAKTFSGGIGTLSAGEQTTIQGGFTSLKLKTATGTVSGMAFSDSSGTVYSILEAGSGIASRFRFVSPDRLTTYGSCDSTGAWTFGPSSGFTGSHTFNGTTQIGGTKIRQIVMGQIALITNGVDGYCNTSFPKVVLSSSKVVASAVVIGGGTNGLALYGVCWTGMIDAVSSRFSLKAGAGYSISYTITEYE